MKRNDSKSRKKSSSNLTTADDGFAYANGELHCEGVALSKIHAEVGTPTYVYSKSAIRNRVHRLRSALQNVDCAVYFAVKACSNIHILNVLRAAGCGADIVSSGELFRTVLAEVLPENIVFSGIGKTAKELNEALMAGIFMFNVESLAELSMLDQAAAKAGKVARVSLRINPDVDAKTHPYISTGLKRNKFGLSLVELKGFKNTFKNIDLCGISCHIGSQILTSGPFSEAWAKMKKIAGQMPFEVKYLNLGGGLGIAYQNEKHISLEEFGNLIERTFKGSKYKLSIEPGRSLVGPTGVLLCNTILVKSRGNHKFAVVDAGMNDLMRPALYGAVHPLLPVVESLKTGGTTVDLVGPVCESADTFEQATTIPRAEPGVLLAIGNAGAYGMSMSSQYNSRPRAAEVLVEGTSYQIIRRRETYADLIQNELI